MAYNTRGSYSHKGEGGKGHKGFRQCCPKTYANVEKNIWSAARLHLPSIAFDLIGTCAS